MKLIYFRFLVKIRNNMIPILCRSVFDLVDLIYIFIDLALDLTLDSI